MTEHIVVIHRWRDRHALYENYLDHQAHHVTYVTTEMGRQAVPPGAAATVVVTATDDLALIREAVAGLAERFGRPARLVALNEGDLDSAALLRAELGCPGLLPEELARYRDKLTMTRMVSDAGVRTPSFADAPDEQAVLDFAEANGWPVIVKPRRGTASRGVVRLNSADDLGRLAELPAEPRLVQDFCGDGIYHIDGLWTGSELGPWRASRYLNTCVDFTTGEVLGSVEEDDPELLAALAEFTASVAGALSGRPWVFHLEAFVGQDEDGRPRLTFLEAGYRVGGAEIPFVWREVHGIDLMSAAIAVQLGEEPRLAESETRRTGGWLLVPTPVPAPCRVVATALRVAPEQGPYAQVVPPVGYRVPKVGGYEHVGARFRFRGASTHDVEKAITETASQFVLECVAD